MISGSLHSLRCILGHRWEVTRSSPHIGFNDFRCRRCGDRVTGPHYGDYFPWPSRRNREQHMFNSGEFPEAEYRRALRELIAPHECPK